ncbi:MAG TPA: hypothetical protein ENF33_04335 [Nitrososphaeria archaeon]|nr:hypothetical protein [Nitrososphaeria archaeon]
MTIFNFIIFPMIFLSNVIIPVSKLSHHLNWISLAIPLTYSVEVVRYVLIGYRYLLHFIFISTSVFLYLAEIMTRRAIP